MNKLRIAINYILHKTRNSHGTSAIQFLVICKVLSGPA